MKKNVPYEFISEIAKYFQSRPITKAFIFGSYARNEAGATSDLDVLIQVDYSNPVSLLDFIGWAIDLENITHKKIDLVAEDGLSKYLKPQIDREKKLIYEKSHRR